MHFSYFPTAVLPVKETSFILGSLAILTPISVPPYNCWTTMWIKVFLHLYLAQCRDGTRKTISLQDICHHFGNGNRCEWSSGGSLPQHYITASHGNSRVPAIHSNWEVEGCNDTNNTKWIPVLKKSMTRSFTWNYLETEANQ